MKKQMKDPGCGCGSGCCAGAMVDKHTAQKNDPESFGIVFTIK